MAARTTASHSGLAASLRVLFLEDDARDARLMAATLERAGCRLTPDRVDSLAEFQQCLEKTPYDVIISDYNLPGWTAMEALNLLRDSGRDIPFLVVSGSLGDEAAAECIKMGATDYVLKDRMARLPAAIGRAMQEKDERLARRKAEERFHQAFNASPEPITISTLNEGRYLEVNTSFLRVTHHSREDVIGRTAVEVGFWRNSDDRDAVMAAVNARGRVTDREFSFGTSSGEVRAGLISAEPIEWTGQQCLLAVVKDITEHKELEQQFRQAQKMEAVGQLAGGVAHDFNNLLMVINGYSEVLLAAMKLEDPLRQHVDEIKKAGDRAQALTRQLLAFSRRQVLMPQIVDLNAVVAGMQNMLGRLIGESIELRAVLAPHLGKVRVDQGQIEQVILNLAVNARDAMPHGGSLTIETGNVDLDESYTRNHTQVKPGQHVLLAVSDTGTGMDAETQKHIFEPFFTTKELGKGTGLGLSTVYGIVQQSEGTIWVYSEAGRGTTFKIYFPRTDQSREIAELAGKHIGARHEGYTILLVEDDSSVRRLVRERLHSMGYQVLEAPNGTKALQIAERQREPIHVLITDVVMPGFGGQVLAERLAASRPETRVLYMSGYTDEAVITNGLVGSAAAFIQKPFTFQALARKLSDLLNLK